MILFRSYKKRILLASLAFALFGAIQASFILPASTISEENVDINVNLVNGVAIRILNSAATAEITELDLSTTAAPTGTFVTDNFKVEVSTANKTGYKLYMNSSYQNPSTSTYTTDLVNQANTSYTIPTVAAAVSKTDLSTAAPGTTNANKWAYSLDDTTYSPVPANSVQAQIDSHDTPTAGTKTPVYIGMNVNVEKPSGVYKNQLTFSAVGNPITTDYSLYFLPGTTETVTDLPPTQTASVVAASHTFTIPSTAPSRTGYNFTGYLDESTSTTYQPGDTITVQGDIDYTGSATLTAQWELASYTITIYNSGTTSGSASISMTYGGSATVTVTPDSGFFLTRVLCPSGYTCTGYSIGPSATSTQTVTVTNNNTESGGNLRFTGSMPIASFCNTMREAQTLEYYDGNTYVKLGGSTEGDCYTNYSQGMSDWTNAESLCPDETRLPSSADFIKLLSYYSGEPFGRRASWNNGNYWTSTEVDSGNAVYFYNNNDTAGENGIFSSTKSSSMNVVCIVIR